MNDEKMNETVNENSNKTESDVNKKIDTAFKAIIVGIIAIFLLQYPSIVYRIPSEVIITVISGAALMFSINAVIFCFIKPRAWLYRVISGAVSLIVGINCYLELLYEWDLSQPVFISKILQIITGDELRALVYRLIVAAVSLICTVTIFGLALIVQYIYKRVKKKTGSTS